MKRSWLVRGLIVLAAAATGYAVANLQHMWSELNQPVVVSQERMAALVAGDCRGDLAQKSDLLSAIVSVFDDPHTPSSDFAITPVKNEGGRSCAFDYALSGNSHVQGRGVARFRDSRTITRIDFFHWLDTDLMKKSRPSFSVFFYYAAGGALIFESLHNKLYLLAAAKDPTPKSFPLGY